MIKTKFILFILFYLLTASVIAQDKYEGHEFMELVQIYERYTSMPDLSFKLNISYAEDKKPNQPINNYKADCKIKGRDIFIRNDSFEILQNDAYNLYIDKQDSVIYVNSTSPFSLLQIPLLDSVFRLAHIEGFSIEDKNDSLSELTCKFKTDSHYKSYSILYYTTIHVIKEINFKQITDGSGDLPLRSILRTTLKFSDYSIEPGDPALFKTERYIQTNQNKILTHASFQGYKIITR